jgi:amidase
MARTVEDAALLLSAQAGPDLRSPISITEPGSIFSGPLDRDFENTHIAWSRDMGGLPVDPKVTAVIENGIGTFEDIGCRVDQAEPDFECADEAFKAWRAFYMELRVDPLLENNRHQIKETVIWNAEQGLKLTGPELARIEAKRTQLYHRVREFMAKYDFMIMPVSQVPPFDVKHRWISEINGVKMETYIDWMKSCYYISVIGHPALSVPCGFTPEGLPVGVQIVGRHNDDLGVLQLGYAFQQATEVWKKHPAI